jgi:hypothetical protein
MIDMPISMRMSGSSNVPRGGRVPFSRMRRIGLSKVNRMTNSAARAVYSISTTERTVSRARYGWL